MRGVSPNLGYIDLILVHLPCDVVVCLDSKCVRLTFLAVQLQFVGRFRH